MMRPGRAAITATRVDRKTASTMLWVTKTTVRPRAAHSARSSVVEPLAREFVERAERFVHQQQVRRGDERPRDRRAHLHAAGELARQLAGESGEADESERRGDVAVGRFAGDAGKIERQPHVRVDARPGHQRRRLEHHRETAAGPAGRLESAAPPPQRAGIRREQARHQVEQRRLPASGGPEQRDELAATDREVDRR